MSQNNPTRRALLMVADKWTILVFFALKERPQRLSAIQRMIEGITQKMLIQTLRKMEADGLALRTVYPVMPPHVEYTLTPLGQSLLPIMFALSQWAVTHLDKNEPKPGKHQPGTAR